MKVCCNSHSFTRALAAGDLTQLEWIDLCANELGLDVEPALSHFPRTDVDYVAQVKKLCVDRGLTVAGLHHDRAIEAPATDEHVAALKASLDVAVGLGAPLVRCAIAAQADSGPPTWHALVSALKEACRHAKERNVVLALEPRTGTPVASPTQAKRMLKECDSAWLRLALDLRAFEPDQIEAWMESLENTVIIVARLGRPSGTDADRRADGDQAAAVAWLHRHRYCGFLSLEYAHEGQGSETEGVSECAAQLQRLVAQEVLRAPAHDTSDP
jgi:hypothetical protein